CGGVELLFATHAVEQVAGLLDRDEVEVDVLDFDISGPERLGAVIEAAGKRQSSHFFTLQDLATSRMNGSSSPSRRAIRALQLVQYALALWAAHTGVSHERRDLQHELAQVSQDTRRRCPAEDREGGAP